MIIASISENKDFENRIAITPEVAKKYVNLDFEVVLTKDYGKHLGIEDNKYLDLGVNIRENESEIINKADIILQLGLLSDNLSSQIKENKTLIGSLNPYVNKDKLNNLIKNINENFKIN